MSESATNIGADAPKPKYSNREAATVSRSPSGTPLVVVVLSGNVFLEALGDHDPANVEAVVPRIVGGGIVLEPVG